MNFGWWLHSALPLFIAIAAIGSVLILIARRSGWSLDLLALVLAVAVVAASIGAGLHARRRSFSKRDALARLDLTLGLYNRLSSAFEGVGAWPPSRPITGIHWRSAALLPGLIAPALLLSALAIPIAPRIDDARAPIGSEPVVWSELEEALDQLAAEDSAVDRAALEEWRERLDELRKQPEEEWFEHSSLEAGDHLRDQLNGAMSELEQDLARAEQALTQQKQSAWKEALSDLDLGKLRLDPELAKELAKLDLEDARTLTPEELAKLKQALAKGVKQVRLAKGEPGEKGEKGDELLLLVQAGQAARAGQGGIDRGRADAELTFRPDPTDASTSESHNLASKDRTHASLGDLVGLSAKDHEIDPSQYAGAARNGGTIGDRGKGGETVWKTSLAPDEQDFLERYFR